MQEEGTTDWKRVNEPDALLTACEWVVPNLKGLRKYKFRVKAVNEAGESEPSDRTGEIIATDIQEVPEVYIDMKAQDCLVCKADSLVKIPVVIKGHPTPKSSLEFDGKAKKAIKLETAENSSVIIIPECRRSHSGKYSITAKNKAAQKTASCRVKVMVPDLISEQQYFFCIRAENHFGIGAPMETIQRTTAKDPVGSSPGDNPGVPQGGLQHPEWSPSHPATTRGLTCGSLFQCQMPGSSPGGNPGVPQEEMTLGPLSIILKEFMEVEEGTDVSIVAKIKGAPFPTLMWFKAPPLKPDNKEPVIYDTRVNKLVVDDTRTLVIPQSRRSDTALYTITAVNNLGTASEEMRLNVLGPPGPPVGPIKFDSVSADPMALS
ncbi:titin-like [Saccopteryx leptura]|uniref:titin-like n=1 Tax=Saccopteryx leptura TaxID=249018 RepID=UPI00339CB6A3